MIVWGTSGRELDLGHLEERDCETCGTRRPFRLMLAYRCFGVYWIFKCVTSRQYRAACGVCQHGWELDRKQVEASLATSPIPKADRFGLLALGAAIVLLVSVAAASAPPSAERNPDGAITASGNVGVFGMRLGDCFNDDEALSSHETVEFTTVAGVPCSEPHDNEVYAVIELDAPTFPGAEEIAGLAFDRCLARFDPFVGRDYETSMFDVLPIYPSERSWTTRGDREVICALYDVNLKPLTGSARKSGR